MCIRETFCAQNCSVKEDLVPFPVLIVTIIIAVKKKERMKPGGSTHADIMLDRHKILLS